MIGCYFSKRGIESFGKNISETILKRYSPKIIIIYSRDELKQYEMCKEQMNKIKIVFLSERGEIVLSELLHRLSIYEN